MASEPTPLDPELITLDVRQVAKHLRVSVRTVETLLKAGQIPPPLRVGSQRRWHRASLLKWIMAGGVAPAV